MREGYPFIAAGVLLAFIAFMLSAAAGLAALALPAFAAFFFRDPPRRITEGDGLVLSPADGQVVGIERIEDEPLIGGPATRVSIFLSLFDVHLNRSPIAGRVRKTVYSPGGKLPAFLPRASCNERRLWVIDGSGVTVLVVQIAGILARRIVQWTPDGSEVAAGEKIGMIRFGSRTELVLPVRVAVQVKRGQQVRAGETVIGVIR